MANLFVNLPLPVLNGPGLAIPTAGMGELKTITVIGDFPGATIAVEASVDGGVTWAPIPAALFQSSANKLVVEVVAQFMRTNVSGRTGAPFTADVDVGANDNGALFAAIPMPAFDGPGPAVNVSAFGSFSTYILGGTFPGAAVLVEVSEDGIQWAPSIQFSGGGGIRSTTATISFVRANVIGRKVTIPFSATLSVGSAVDAGSSISSGGSSTCLIYRPGSELSGPVVFESWPDLMAHLALLRADANGSGCYTIQSDNSLVFPLAASVPPGGPYDFTNVTLEGIDLVPQVAPTLNALEISDGATFKQLRTFRGALHVINLNTVTPADATLGTNTGEIITATLGVILENRGAAPLWRIIPGGIAAIGLLLADVFGTIGHVIDLPAAGTIMAIGAGAGARIDGSAWSGVAGSFIQIGRQSSGATLASVYPAFLGTLAVSSSGWTAAAEMRPQPFGGPPITVATPIEYGSIARCSVAGGPFAVTLPPLSTNNTGADFNPGCFVVVTELSGLPGLTIVPGPGDTINGAGGPLAVSGGNSVILINDGFSDWRVCTTPPVSGPPNAIGFFSAGGLLIGDAARWAVDPATGNVIIGNPTPGNTSHLFINQTVTDHGSSADVQVSSLVSNAPTFRCNQYGNPLPGAGIPGLSTLKSRGLTIGALAPVVDTDVLLRLTAVGVPSDGISVPLAGLVSIKVPVGGVPPGAPGFTWVATDFEVQLVPLTGPINGRMQAFLVDSQGILHVKEVGPAGAPTSHMAGLAVTGAGGTIVVPNVSVKATTKFLLTVQDGGVAPLSAPYQSARVIGTSFTIQMINPLDVGVQVYYQLWEPTAVPF